MVTEEKEMITVKENPPSVGLVVLYEGLTALVCYNPFSSDNRDTLGWFYKHPDRDIRFWRPLHQYDEYKVVKKDYKYTFKCTECGYYQQSDDWIPLTICPYHGHPNG